MCPEDFMLSWSITLLIALLVTTSFINKGCMKTLRGFLASMDSATVTHNNDDYLFLSIAAGTH